MPRNSHQDALTEPQFEQLFDAARDLHEPFETECTAILFFAGRLGMRGGEICHIDEGWVDWDRKMIEIPRYDTCTKGSNGDVCGYCKQQARLAVAHDDDLTMEKALRERWQPKTSNSARAIPFDFNDRVEAIVRAFFDGYDAYPASRASINRRVTRLCEEAGYSADLTYPHALRATAATYHAYRGVSAPALQSLFGWAQLNVAQKYIRLSGGATADALHDAHS